MGFSKACARIYCGGTHAYSIGVGHFHNIFWRSVKNIGFTPRPNAHSSPIHVQHDVDVRRPRVAPRVARGAVGPARRVPRRLGALRIHAGRGPQARADDADADRARPPDARFRGGLHAKRVSRRPGRRRARETGRPYARGDHREQQGFERVRTRRRGGFREDLRGDRPPAGVCPGRSPPQLHRGDRVGAAGPGHRRVPSRPRSPRWQAAPSCLRPRESSRRTSTPRCGAPPWAAGRSSVSPRAPE